MPNSPSDLHHSLFTMAPEAATANSSHASAETVEEITSIYRSLPPRPSVEAVEAANSVLLTVETEEKLQLEDISRQSPPEDVHPELFSVLQDVRKTMVRIQSLAQKKEASQIIERDKIFKVFDSLIQKASELVLGRDHGATDGEIEVEENVSIVEKHVKGVDRNDLKTAKDLKGCLQRIPESDPVVQSSEYSEKLDLLNVASIIESSAKSGARILDLKGKLMDKVEWLPISLGKLSTITELYLSENQIMALPTSIGDLKTLMILDLHANQILNLPSSFGEMQNLRDVDVSANMLKSLPDSFGSLTNLCKLDLSINRFSNLPNAIGKLSSLKKLNVETNNIEELPSVIGLLSSLTELRLDFNQLRVLPEAMGNLDQLEILTLHYNRVKKLPSTMGNLTRLRELDVSFNELEIIPETLCFVTSLRKLKVGKNFADLRTLPESLGNLEMLEELDISHNQIKTLPDSFRLLSMLRIFCADQTPLESPPMQITKLGAQGLVQYMADLVAERDLKSLQVKKKKWFCSSICPFSCFGIGSL